MKMKIQKKISLELQNELKDKVINNLLKQVSFLYSRNKILEKEVEILKKEIVRTLKSVIKIKEE